MNEKMTEQLVDLLNEKVLRLSNAYDRVCKENRSLTRANKKLAKENAAARQVRNMLCDFVIDELHINELLNGDGAPNYDERGARMGKLVSDEKLLSSLLTSGSIPKTAHELGISRGAIYKRFENPSFRARYAELQGSLLESTVIELSVICGEAVETLRGVMSSTVASPQTRVNAANYALTHFARLTETADLTRRITELEKFYRNEVQK